MSDVSSQTLPVPTAPVQPTYYVTGVRRWLYVALGWTSVVVAVVGIAIPGVPAFLFVVLAAYLFIRSSPSAHAWLRQSRWFGAIVRDWEEQHAVRRSVKYPAACLIVAAMVCIAFAGLSPMLMIAGLVPEIIALIVVLSLPVAKFPATEEPSIG